MSNSNQQLQFQSTPANSAKKSDKDTIEKLTQEYLSLAKNNDKALSEQEIDFEKNAIDLNIIKFPRIHPRKATIGFMVRSIDGGAFQAIEFIRASFPVVANNTGRISHLMQLVQDFDKLDEDSKSRVDCLDWLCRRNSISISRFVTALKEGIIAFYNDMTSIAVAEKKPELARKVFEYANKEKHIADRRLASEIAGLTGRDSPAVVIDQSTKSTNITNNNAVLSFSDFVKKNDNEIRGKKLIGEGENFVGAEFEEVKE